MKMTTRAIVSIEDLEREEYAVRLRLKEKEREIAARFKQIPDELIDVGVTVISNKIATTGWASFSLSILKKIGQKLFDDKPNAEDAKGSLSDTLIDGISSTLKSMFKKNTTN